MNEMHPDEHYMDQALALAERGRGQTTPNPMVGAVVVGSDGAVVGTGYHERAGGAHAEVHALAAAGERSVGSTLYCTLEPCSHYGRTGPCVERIIDAGVSRIVVAVVDPNPSVSGAGIAYLRERGRRVDVGVRERVAGHLNEAFFTWVTQGRPFVTMKIAVSLDGRIAARPGARTALTSAAAERAVHRARAEVDAIGVGSDTLLVDDPLLTARGVDRTRPLTRVVFDRRLRTPTGARLLQTLSAGPVVIMTTVDSLTRCPTAVSELRDRGARVEAVSDRGVAAAMRRLGELEITTLLLEGGVRIHRAAWVAGVVDRVQRFVAPVSLGDAGVPWLDEELKMMDLKDVTVHRYGPDVLTEGYVQRVG
jgi:diaminohydroxyphosphoribosylaminopyrimidine deaminase/5-amino-6-(5-phosphoribosylamino)uracil reductase